MKTWIFLGITVMGLLAVAFFVSTVQDVRETGKGPKTVEWVKLTPLVPGGPAPDFKVIDVRQNPYQLSESRKVKLVNFWASWCGPCLQEIPSMAELARKRAGDLEVIAISCDSVEKDFRRALNLFPDFNSGDIRIVFDQDKKVMSAYNVSGFPETFVISPEGRLIKRIVGPMDWGNLPEDFLSK